MICLPLNLNSEEYLEKESQHKFDLSFVDPPFNQAKKYRKHKDKMPETEYWEWMERICRLIYKNTTNGGAIYFMQREKNTQFVLEILKKTGWNLQNLIIWKKKSSAVPSEYRYGKHYQIIAYATKNEKETVEKNRKKVKNEKKTGRVFNRLRIDPPLLVTEKYERPDGMYVTDVWDDIREMTSGYLAGDEALRDENGHRKHEQQSPIALLIRIILSSTKPGDFVFDPFAGSGTTLVVSKQLERNSIGVELDPYNFEMIKERIENIRESDDVNRFREDYSYTENLDEIWGSKEEAPKSPVKQKKSNEKKNDTKTAPDENEVKKKSNKKTNNNSKDKNSIEIENIKNLDEFEPKIKNKTKRKNDTIKAEYE